MPLMVVEATAGNYTLNAVIGGGIGGDAGAAIGNEIGGRDGAIICGAQDRVTSTPLSPRGCAFFRLRSGYAGSWCPNTRTNGQFTSAQPVR
jgi:hypothetical protein